MPTPYVPVQVVVNGKTQSFTYKAPLSYMPIGAENEWDFVSLWKPLDKVVVDFGKLGWIVGTIESVNEQQLDPTAKFQYKWIIQKIDLSAYKKLIGEDHPDA